MITLDETGTAHSRQNTAKQQAVIMFDGVCNLCNGWVNFVIKRDECGYFAFASLQSAAARDLLSRTPLPENYLDSIVLWENGRCHVRSASVLRILRKLDGFWPLAYAFVLVPAPLRDFIYDRIAAKRYAWFGKKDFCPSPAADVQSRFLD